VRVSTNKVLRIFGTTWEEEIMRKKIHKKELSYFVDVLFT
jgi:hypothetical protein